MPSFWSHKWKHPAKVKALHLFRKKNQKFNKKTFTTRHHGATKTPARHSRFHRKRDKHFDDGQFQEGAQSKTKEEV